MMTNRNIYVYKLPHSELRELCRILDQNNKWEELGGAHMKYDHLTIQSLRKEIYRGNSPTEELLTLWGHQNHTVLELFVLLSRMKHYQAMTAIKSQVDTKFHVMINEANDNLDCLLEDLVLRRHRSKDLVILQENLDDCKILNDGRRLDEPVNTISRENNESIRFVARAGPPSDITSVAESAGAIPQIPYDELRSSTNDWDTTAVLGKGGFGTVFKGVWKCTQVAIKRIEQKEDSPESHSEQVKQSITELHCLNAYRHDNVLPLYGYSIGGPQPCLVYQYMSGGSLEHRLRSRDRTKCLSWSQRVNVAVGTARGLQFLHTIGEKPLIHGDIKPANILLDPNDNAKIGDFGLAREGPHANYTHVKVSRIHGTRPYLPDEFLRSKKISTKVDTYSFGVVLFELATALQVYVEQRANKFLRDHVVEHEGDVVELKDKRLFNGDECCRSLIEIGRMCVSKKPKDRPEMVAVLLSLEEISVSD